MKVAISGIGIAVAAALTLGAASIASAQQSNPSGTLMQERQGAIGVEKGAEKPAAQATCPARMLPPPMTRRRPRLAKRPRTAASVSAPRVMEMTINRSRPNVRALSEPRSVLPNRPPRAAATSNKPIHREAARRKVTSARRFQIPSVRSGAGPAIPSRAATRGRCRPGYRLFRAPSPCPSPPTVP